MFQPIVFPSAPNNLTVATHPIKYKHFPTGLKYKVWKNGDGVKVADKWEAVTEELQESPHNITFSGIKISAMKSHFEYMVSNVSSQGTQAQRESGGGTDGTEEDSGETEEEKKTAADLVIID